MSALLYAIAGCEPAAVPARAADGRRLRAVGPGPVAILDAEGGGGGEGEAALRAHARTVNELMAAHPLLPARYGTRVSDEEATALVRDHPEALRAALSRVAGAVELAVSARMHGEAGAGEKSSGAAYLQARLAQRRRGQAVLEHLQALIPLAREHVCRDDGQDGPSVRVAYLVERERVAEFVAAVRELDETYAELELVCTGPWPPYSFSGGWR